MESSQIVATLTRTFVSGSEIRATIEASSCGSFVSYQISTCESRRSLNPTYQKHVAYLQATDHQSSRAAYPHRRSFGHMASVLSAHSPPWARRLAHQSSRMRVALPQKKVHPADRACEDLKVANQPGAGTWTQHYDFQETESASPPAARPWTVRPPRPPLPAPPATKALPHPAEYCKHPCV